MPTKGEGPKRPSRAAIISILGMLAFGVNMFVCNPQKTATFGGATSAPKASVDPSVLIARKRAHEAQRAQRIAEIQASTTMRTRSAEGLRVGEVNYWDVVSALGEAPTRRRKSPDRHPGGHSLYEYLWDNDECPPVIAGFDGTKPTAKLLDVDPGQCKTLSDDSTKRDAEANKAALDAVSKQRGWLKCTSKRCPGPGSAPTPVTEPSASDKADAEEARWTPLSRLADKIPHQATYRDVVRRLGVAPVKKRLNPNWHPDGVTRYDYLWDNKECTPITISFDGAGTSARATGVSTGLCLVKGTKRNDEANRILTKTEHSLPGWRKCNPSSCPGP